VQWVERCSRSFLIHQRTRVAWVMYEIIRQSDPEFKGVIQMMRDGTMDRAGAQYCLDRSLGKLSEEERRNFEQTSLYIMPTWKRTIPITKQYLKDLEQAVARIDCQYRPTYMEGRPNHAAKECNMPVRNALCKCAVVMLLQSFVVEQQLKNGSIGTVVEVVYKEPAGPRQIGNPHERVLFVIYLLGGLVFTVKVDGEHAESTLITVWFSFILAISFMEATLRRNCSRARTTKHPSR
jgi:hypothetical protein